ncbi:hypothetical protein [Actomonas aquatica]|uniref:Uncharacterized protein n=1 Tax=Actomonas aquatica TaxID=2866162 RepID=A0ABZ1C7V4_9BACT|nr:hypothetical protein [Opitutus sp. WL0086]WRQ87528.1 hypothetical protein K1X11_022155 [Opitutus sp. WL0086]
MRFLFILSVLAAVGLVAKEPIYPEMEDFSAGAAVVALAEREGLPLTGVTVAGAGRERPEAGDRAVVLISMRDDDEVEQWLAEFRLAELNAEEAAQVASADVEPLSIYTSTGSHYTFERDLVAVEVTVWGPLDQDEGRIERALAKVTREQARFLVNAEFLQVGLDRAAGTILRLRDDTGRVGISMRNTPFPEEEARATRAELEERGVREEDVRSVVGSLPALVEFFGIAAQTPGLKGILFEVVDVPWWALVKGLGSVNANINLDGNRLRRVPETAASFVVPFAVELNGVAALTVELVAQPPKAPASVLAGVTAVYAGRPKGGGKRVSIQLLAATVSDASAEK